METMTEKRRTGFEKIFKTAEDDVALARNILNNVEIIPSDLDVLIGYMTSAYFNVHVLATESAMKILAKALGADVLDKWEDFDDVDVRELVTKLKKKIEIAKRVWEEEAEILGLFEE